MSHRTPHRQLPAASRGLSLVELLVSLAIGTFLIGGALSVYIKGRGSYELNETISRMQESATFAIRQIEADAQLAGMWGNHRSFAAVERSTASGMTPIDAGVTNDCTANWSVDVVNFIAGVDNDDPGWACVSDADHVDETDMLVIRRASSRPVLGALQAGQLYVRSSAAPRSTLFVGATQPGGYSVEASNYRMLARAYYVRANSVGNNITGQAIPSLRRLDSVLQGGQMQVVDLEVAPGIEDMQIQFGIAAPVADPLVDRPAGVELYVDPDSPMLANNTILSVRVWLLVRAENPEPGYVDDKIYNMAGSVRAATNDNYRRLLVTRTIALRNRI